MLTLSQLTDKKKNRMCVFVLQISFFRESVCLAASYAWVCQGNFHKCCNSRSKGSQTSPICSLFTLSANTPRKRMIMSVHCTVKSYQNIFLVLPPHDGQRKRVTHFVSEGCFLFCFVFFPYLEFGDLASPPGPSAMF